MDAEAEIVLCVVRLFGLALKWFGPDGAAPVDYEGGRDLDSLAKL